LAYAYRISPVVLITILVLALLSYEMSENKALMVAWALALAHRSYLAYVPFLEAIHDLVAPPAFIILPY
jgi:hypothetical protein